MQFVQEVGILDEEDVFAKVDEGYRFPDLGLTYDYQETDEQGN